MSAHKRGRTFRRNEDYPIPRQGGPKLENLLRVSKLVEELASFSPVELEDLTIEELWMLASEVFHLGISLLTNDPVWSCRRRNPDLEVVTSYDEETTKKEGMISERRHPLGLQPVPLSKEERQKLQNFLKALYDVFVVASQVPEDIDSLLRFAKQAVGGPEPKGVRPFSARNKAGYRNRKFRKKPDKERRPTRFHPVHASDGYKIYRT
jgi:hypothetical protein